MIFFVLQLATSKFSEILMALVFQLLPPCFQPVFPRQETRRFLTGRFSTAAALRLRLVAADDLHLSGSGGLGC